MYDEYRFKNPEQAARKQKEIKKQYGYKPEVYLIQNPTQTWFGFAIPKGIVPINKKDKLGSKVFDF